MEMQIIRELRDVCLHNADFVRSGDQFERKVPVRERPMMFLCYLYGGYAFADTGVERRA